MTDAIRIELGLIAQDNSELIRLVKIINKSQDSGVIGLGLSPLIALFAEEGFNYLTDIARQGFGDAPSASLFEYFSEATTKLRARTKLFDDNRGGLNGLIDTLTLAYRRSSERFLSQHRGFLGRLKRRLQHDLGIYYLGEHVVCTTHTALLTVGLALEHHESLEPLELKNVGTFTYEFSVAAGEFIGQLALYLIERGYNIDIDPSLENEEIELSITHNDHYGHLVYKYISDNLGLVQPELSSAILFLLAQINFVERVLAQLLPSTSTYLLRARFMIAYHATTAIQELDELNNHSDGNVFGVIARDILAEPDSDFLLGARQVRNLMAHYGLRSASQLITSGGDPMNDVLIGLCGNGVVEVSALVQRQLSRISDAFVDIVSKTTLKGSRALLGDHT